MPSEAITKSAKGRSLSFQAERFRPNAGFPGRWLMPWESKKRLATLCIFKYDGQIDVMVWSGVLGFGAFLVVVV